MVRVGYLKGFIDGTLGVRSAWKPQNPFPKSRATPAWPRSGEQEFYSLLEKADISTGSRSPFTPSATREFTGFSTVSKARERKREPPGCATGLNTIPL